MTINNRKFHDVQFTYEELKTLEGAERALAEVAVAFGTECTLVAAETGECVQLSELDRVRAILDFFCDHRVFEVV